MNLMSAWLFSSRNRRMSALQHPTGTILTHDDIAASDGRLSRCESRRNSEDGLKPSACNLANLGKILPINYQRDAFNRGSCSRRHGLVMGIQC